MDVNNKTFGYFVLLGLVIGRGFLVPLGEPLSGTPSWGSGRAPSPVSSSNGLPALRPSRIRKASNKAHKRREEKRDIMGCCTKGVIVVEKLLLLLLVVVSPLWPTRVRAQTSDLDGLSPPELAAFVDDLIAGQLAERHIPGVLIAVVKDGASLLIKGYGYADLEQGQPVLANQTLFRTGSVAKLFTWTAVMQLVEQGKLELDRDVKPDLRDFRIPNTYPQPITLEHLLTHTAGFEDGSMGMIRRRPEDLEPLGVFLASKYPARVFPPGYVTVYSNYGTALAGYLVERLVVS